MFLAFLGMLLLFFWIKEDPRRFLVVVAVGIIVFLVAATGWSLEPRCFQCGRHWTGGDVCFGCSAVHKAYS